MWDILLALLILLLDILRWIASKLLNILWWITSKQPCSSVANGEERVKFLLTLLVESRWSGLTYKLLYRHRHHRGLMSADDPLDDDSAAAASVLAADRQVVRRRRTPLSLTFWTDAAWTHAGAGRPLCPRCNQPMQMKRNRMNHGLFWGCVAYPACKGTRRPGDTGDDQ